MAASPSEQPRDVATIVAALADLSRRHATARVALSTSAVVVALSIVAGVIWLTGGLSHNRLIFDAELTFLSWLFAAGTTAILAWLLNAVVSIPLERHQLTERAQLISERNHRQDFEQAQRGRPRSIDRPGTELTRADPLDGPHVS